MKIIKFNAVWCPACLIMRPRINEVLASYPVSSVTEYDYDIDEAEVEQWEIGSILPVMIVLDKNDRELIRVVGEKSKKEIIKMIDSVALDVTHE